MLSIKSHILVVVFFVLLEFGGVSLAQKPDPAANKPPPSRVLSAKEIARTTLPAVVLLLCDDPQTEGYTQGSGFFVKPGILVTNYHVIKGNTRGLVQIAIGVNREKMTFRIARVIDFDEESDLALLSVPSAKKANVPFLPLSVESGSIEIGEIIYALGNPEGLVGTISPGIVSASLRSTQKKARLQITAPISHGSSGGPIVNGSGRVIGVAVGSLSDGQNLNFAVPSSLVSSLLSASWSMYFATIS